MRIVVGCGCTCRRYLESALDSPVTITSQRPAELRILAVLQGSGGGIGRLELLYIEMLRALREAGEIQFDSVSRAPHPAYLGSGSDPAIASRRHSKIVFSVEVL